MSCVTMTSHKVKHTHHTSHMQVTLSGFGPFAGPITYPLAGRGVVAVTGLNLDDVAAVSNGSGCGAGVPRC
jgi:hypothetical protein